MASVARHKQRKNHLSDLLNRLPSILKKPESQNDWWSLGGKYSDQLRQIGSYFEVSNEDKEIAAMLSDNATLRRVILEAIDAIPEYYPETRRSSIQLRRAGEGRSNPYLVVRVDTGRPVDEARELRDRFDKEWWLRRFPDVYPHLLMDVEYHDVAI